MKTYKIKSLIYLSCFVLVAVAYHQIEQNENFQKLLVQGHTAELEAEDQLPEQKDESKKEKVRP